MSYDEMTPQQLRELLAARDAHLQVMIAHVADAEARLNESPLIERLARDLYVMCGTNYVRVHDEHGSIPVDMLRGIATDCWTAAAVFARAPRSRTPTAHPVEGV